MVDPSVEIRAKAAFCVVAMLNVQLEITTHYVRVNQVLLAILKLDVVALNAKMMRNVQLINSARRIYVNQYVKLVNLAARKLYALRKIIRPFAIVSLAIVVIHTFNVMLLTSVAMLHADQALCVLTTKAPSTVLVATVTLVIHTTKAVDLLSNARAIQIVHRAQNAFKQIADRNVVMYANDSLAVQIQIVCQLIIKPLAIAGRDTVAMQTIFKLDVDHYQCPARSPRIVRLIHTATVDIASQHAL